MKKILYSLLFGLLSLSGLQAFAMERIDKQPADEYKNVPYPLHVACYNGRYDKAKLLLENGRYVDETDPKGETPLHWAATKNQSAIIRLLLNQGADARRVTNDGTTIIDQIQFKSGHTAAQIFFEHGAPHPKNVQHQVLLTKGLDRLLNFNSFFEKKLFYEIWKDGTQSLKELIKYASGKELNATDLDGNTPLIWTVIRNNPDAMNALLSLHDNDNAMMRSLRNRLCSIPLIGTEIQHPIAIDKRGHYGRTALAWAAYLGNRNLYHELLKRGAKRLIRDSNGRIPLNLAVDCGHLELFKDMLFERPSVLQLLQIEHKYASANPKK